MISASEFRKGITIEKDGSVLEIIDFQHVKPGKGSPFVRTKFKDIINGGVTETTFRPTEKFPQARIDRKDFQYFTKTAICSYSWILRHMSRFL
jgi:Translation elongation factor P (EF-P)/translation initiation factor 5A (eIF-5A)